jgi:hypothetical protein
MAARSSAWLSCARGGRDHHQPRHVHEPGLERLRVLRRRGAPDADRHPDDGRHAALAAEHEAVLRRLVDDLVHRAQREVDHPHLDHRLEPGQRHAHRGADDRGLGDRRVDHALRAEALGLQPAVLAEDAAAAEVLAQRHHARVGLHRQRAHRRRPA